MKNSLGFLHPLSKLGFVLITSALAFLVTMIIGTVLAIPFMGMEGILSALNSSSGISEDSLGFLRFLQIIQSVGLFIVPSLIIAFFFDKSIGSYLKLNKLPYSFSIVLSILIIFIANPAINFFGELNSNLSLPAGLAKIEEWMRSKEDSAAELTKLFLKAETPWGLLFNIFMIALLPAIGEEFLFRGVIQRIFNDLTKNAHLAIWFSAILFSALHFQFYGFVPRAILGAMFGYLFFISGNLWLPVIAHFVNNASAVLAYYLYGEGILNVEPEKIGVDSKYQIAVILSILLLGVTYMVFNNYEIKKRSSKGRE